MAKGSTIDDYRVMTDEQLTLAVRDLEKEIFQLRFKSVTERLDTPTEIKRLRRDIARIKTLQRERELKKENANG
ncbi:MAG: 50S ribosomal protein L29 [Gemmataceae bacterium]|jgi:large subunit ribosomal protein L29|nr:50S ribosomal protein L29 [Gemmataceae bacterium]